MQYTKIDRSPRGFAARMGISPSNVYKEIRAGRLNAKKLGKRTIISEQAEQAWLDALPDVEVDEHGRITSGGDSNLLKQAG